jgi:hypothetical protein
MAINKNHEFEEIDGIRCSIVEKNALKERIDFLRPLLEFNRYTVKLLPSPPPKAVPPPPGTEIVVENAPPGPETFTVAVTDVMFNPTNAIFGRLLRTPGGHVVTLAYWNQEETAARDEIPYYENKP